MADGAAIVRALTRATRTIQIVFLNVSDPVGAGFVESLANTSGNITGFSAFEYQTSGKWLELLKDIAPRVTRVAILQIRTIPIERRTFVPSKPQRKTSQ